VSNEPESEACGAPTKSSTRCRTRGTFPDHKCFFHSIHVTPEQRSEAGRRGAASTNHAATVRRLKRETEAAMEVQRAATAALRPQEHALVAPAMDGGPVAITTPQEVEAVISHSLGAVMGGTLPPSRSKAVVELLRVRIELASLAISERLMKLEKYLQGEQAAKAPGRAKKGARR